MRSGRHSPKRSAICLARSDLLRWSHRRPLRRAALGLIAKFDIQNYGSFIAAIVAFQMVPGPGTTAILNATARNGASAGMGAVFGTLLGDLLFMVAAVAGLAAVMQANPLLFSLLQWFGAAYLVCLGVQLLIAKLQPPDNVEPEKSPRDYFIQAF